jgi:hypothetical protein
MRGLSRKTALAAFLPSPAVLVALLLPPAAHAAAPDPLACRMEKFCIVGKACVPASEEFVLEPVPGGYGASIDGGWIEIALVSPPEAKVKTFLLTSAESVSVLLSHYPDGALALTMHEDIDGRYVETSYGHCVLETM